ncbi:MAG: hypothetical protein ACRDRA_06560 [Pseudonocardiaceae bacterium]
MPAEVGLVHEPGLLLSGLSGRRVSVALVDRLLAMVPELRAMDDVAGGGTMLSLAEQEFGGFMAYQATRQARPAGAVTLIERFAGKSSTSARTVTCRTCIG